MSPRACSSSIPLSSCLSSARCSYLLLVGLAVLALMAGVPAIASSAPAPVPDHADRSRIIEQYARLPLSFIENRGQADARIDYYLQSPHYDLYFDRGGHSLRLTDRSGDTARAHVVKVRLLGAKTRRIESRRSAPGIVSYFKGPASQWRTGIQTQAEIGYVQPWPGIDLSYNGNGGTLESVYTVAPHADPRRIRLRYSGHQSLRIDARGDLVYRTALGEVRETAPIVYQDIDGKRTRVDGRYRLIDRNTVGFKVARYDRAHALVIDPSLVYAGFIGGNNGDVAHGVAVDASGNAYVTGYTSSTPATFPLAAGLDNTYGGGVRDAFVAKVNAAGTALVYAGYIGGIGDDEGYGIAVDSAGAAYIAGNTSSTQTTFPVLGGPDLTHNGGGDDAFIVKINPAGTALVYSGYVGGALSDRGRGIAVDSVGSAYIVGDTFSSQTSFPVIVGPDLTANFNIDGFIAKLSVDGSSLVYAGFIGGNNIDEALAIAVDGSGTAYVTGYTGSSAASFPISVGPDLTFNGASDAYVVKVDAGGTGFVYGGYIGGSGNDEGRGIAVDGAGNAYVSGFTASPQASFPVLVGPSLVYGGNTDAFIAKVNATGSALVYAGYIGGNDIDQGYGIAVDTAGNAYVAGYTRSTQASFPVVSGPGLIFNGGDGDAFIAKVNTTGSALVYAGYIGGSSLEEAFDVDVDASGSAYVVGSTSSTAATFQTLVGPDITSNGGLDVFIAKIEGASTLIFANGFE